MFGDDMDKSLELAFLFYIRVIIIWKSNDLIIS